MSRWKHEQWLRQEKFWEGARAGLTWTAACEAAGVDRAQGYRWRRARGGRVPPEPREVSARVLSLEERLRIADLHRAGHGVRAIGRALGRAPSTISRELTCAGVPTAGPGRARPHGRGGRGGTAEGVYEPYTAHHRAAARARRPKVMKLDDPVVGAELGGYVTAKMDERWSPHQISCALVRDFPDRQELRVSPETIYQSLYVQGRAPAR